MNTKGLFIGLTTLDIQYFVNEHPVANTKIKADAPVVAAGGPAANAAIAYAIMGEEAHFLTHIGQNHFSFFLNSDMQKHGVKVIDASKGYTFEPVIASVVTNVSNSHRTIITHHPSGGELNDSELQGIQVADYAFVFTDGFFPETAVPFLRKAKEKNVPVIFDGGSWKAHMPEILPFVDIGIFSDNFNPPNCKNYHAIFEYLQQIGIKYAAISRGNEAILTSDTEIPVEQVKAIDSLGAGDILHGSFCHYFLQHNNFEKALSQAAETATFSTLFKGTREWIQHWKNKK